MDFINKVNSAYDKGIRSYRDKGVIDAIKTAARGKDVIEQLPDRKHEEFSR